jgi:hypothetical protein
MTKALEWGEGSASRLGCSLPPGKTRYPLYRRVDWPHGRSGQVRKVSPPTGIGSQDRPVCSQSLYRLSYRAHTKHKDQCKFMLMSLRIAVRMRNVSKEICSGNGNIIKCFFFFFLRIESLLTKARMQAPT